MVKKSIRIFMVTVMTLSMCFIGCNNQDSQTQEVSEIAGPIYDKEAAEAARTSGKAMPGTSVSPAAMPTPTPISKPTVTPAPKVTSTPTPAIIPSVTPQATATPTVTPSPAVTNAGEITEGTLSKPNHPEAISPDKLIFIGDSRTEGIRDAVNDDSIWSCLSSMGYDWMESTGVPQVESEIGANTAVIILMGVNDVYQLNNYIQYINAKASEWEELGAKTYFVSVGPVEHDPYVTNEEIVNFNQSMQQNLTGVTYIDIYSYLVENGFSTTDGIHYPASVSIDIYNYILDHLEKFRSGIWG